MQRLACQHFGISAKSLKRQLGLGSYQTARTWLHQLRRAMVRPGRERLAGQVEVDETPIGALTDFVKANVDEGTVVNTDGWSGYCELPDHGYRHRTRTIGRDSKRASKLFPRVHRAFSLLRR